MLKTSGFAITVILAAVIAAFVFGMSGNVAKTKVVAITAERQSGTVFTVMNQGGQDNPTFDYGVVTVKDATGAVVTYSVATSGKGCGAGVLGCHADDSTALATTAGAGELGHSVGDTLTGTFTGGDPGKIKVTIVGHFTDNTAQVLLDTGL